MSIYVETFSQALTKFGEELCGDRAEVVRTSDSVIAVVADGLGSGVKANILATLTTKIASSMLRQGASLDEVVETLASTLPLCQVRQLAYSTFLILQIFVKRKEAYLVEFDCPETFLWRKGNIRPIEKVVRTIAGRKVKEARFQVEEGDVFLLTTDGVIHAGVGGVLNLGWQWENVAQYLEKVLTREADLPKVVSMLSNVCQNLYMFKPGDDATMMGVKVKPIERVTLFTGPPEDACQDEAVVNQFLEGSGQKVVCGGTTAQIVSRISQRPLLTSLEFSNPEVPPMALIPGIDLVTEGVLTLSRTLGLIQKVKGEQVSFRELQELNKPDAASRLARTLLCHCTHLRILAGRAINPAHQNPELPRNLSIRLKVVDELASELRSLGKEVEVLYF